MPKPFRRRWKRSRSASKTSTTNASLCRPGPRRQTALKMPAVNDGVAQFRALVTQPPARREGHDRERRRDREDAGRVEQERLRFRLLDANGRAVASAETVFLAPHR